MYTPGKRGVKWGMKTIPKSKTARPPAVSPQSPLRGPVMAGTARQRSKVTNGALHLGRVNGNTAEARRFKDLVSSFLAEAGITAPTEGQIGLCRRVAGATCQLEAMEAAMSRGEHVDCLEYSRIDGVLRRNRIALGLEIGVPATEPDPDLDEILEREGFDPVS